MTYLPAVRSRRLARRTQRRARPMGDFIDDVSNAASSAFSFLGIGAPNTPSGVLNQAVKIYSNSMTSDCITSADAATADLDARWYSLAKNWNPTGVFTPTDIDTVTKQVFGVVIQAKTMVLLSPATSSDASTMILQAVDDCDKAIAAGAKYTNAIGAAAAAGTPINAPDLKDWVLSSMIAASGAFATNYVLNCDVTTLETWGGYLQAVVDVVMKIIGIVIKAGETVLDVASNSLDFIAWLSKYGPYAALGLGALILYNNYGGKKK